MYANPDKFTDYDRALMEDPHGLEVARTRTVINESIVQVFEKRECFTFTHPDLGDIRFDVHSIKRALLDGRLKAQMWKVEVPTDFYEHVLKNNGVEPERLETLTERDLQRPGIMIGWPDGHSTLIDGNHRLCGLYKRGVTAFRFFMVSIFDCTKFMCRPGEEASMFEGEPNEKTIAGKVWVE